MAVSPLKNLIMILFQVDETLLSGDDGNSYHYHHHPSLHHLRHTAQSPAGSASGTAQQIKQQPWVRMALPGGGIVSMPLASAPESITSPTGEPLLPGGDSASLRSAGSGSATGLLSSSAVDPAADLITLSSSGLPPDSSQQTPPVTHFNLDQLLEIVQSFQLDTTLAGHDGGGDGKAGSAGGRGELIDILKPSFSDNQLLLQVRVKIHLYPSE